MSTSSQQPNERLLNDAMSTSSLDSFYNNVEQQFISRLENSAPIAATNGNKKWWIGLGGGAALLILTSAIVWYVNSTNDVREIPNVSPTTTEAVPQTPVAQRPASTPAMRVAPEPARRSGSTSEAKVTAQAQPTRSMSTQTQRDIDSLTLALRSASSTADAARIGYQLGLRYRLSGDNVKALDLLLTSSTAAQGAGANVLAARGRQQAAKAALQLGDRSRAATLYNQALTILPTTESRLRDQWQSELDSLLR